MDIEEIKKRIQEIASKSGDDETQHGQEDALRAAFIEAVAREGSYPWAEMAKEILKTDDMDFARWCA